MVAVIGVQRMVSAPPEAVWEVLADGWLYAGWVVGASRMRAVDPTWPAPDARLHHSVGGWPLLLDDTTSVLEADPGRELVLKARAWPMGAARVRVLLAAHDGGTLVRMEEDVTSGRDCWCRPRCAGRRSRYATWRACAASLCSRRDARKGRATATLLVPGENSQSGPDPTRPWCATRARSAPGDPSTVTV